MNINKLKNIFVLCFLGLIILIMVTSCNFNEMIKKDEIIQPSNTNVESVHKLEKFNYNNLSDSQKEYLVSVYSDNVVFTNRGAEIYFEGDYGVNLNKIITSIWPEEGMGNIIPKAEYGELDRIEYSKNWIEIYINNVSKKDVNDYLKKLKRYNFTQNEQKDDGKVLLRYTVYDLNGSSVETVFYKASSSMKISARKTK